MLRVPPTTPLFLKASKGETEGRLRTVVIWTKGLQILATWEGCPRRRIQSVDGNIRKACPAPLQSVQEPAEKETTPIASA
jgi:hypothetical protein